MIDCKFMERRDVSAYGSDVFDHPTYKFFCNRSGDNVELLSPFCVEACKYCIPKKDWIDCERK